MKIECDVKDLFSSINIEEERKKRIKEREEQIKYEYNLFKCFCKLFELKPYLASSLTLFIKYCEENSINLVR